jgi:drug/metabolite transporter (DMT)-like permease
VSSQSRALLQIHFCVLLWGFTAILGKTITLGALPLVWWRMTLVVLALLLFPPFWRGLGKLAPRQILIFAGIGVLVALHWLAFYGAIKLSNASVAATCMALTPLITALAEPALTGSRFASRDLAMGLAVIPGVVFLVGGTPLGMRTGIAVGLVSAGFAAVFGVLNKRFVARGTPLAMTGLEMGAGAVFLLGIGTVWPGEEWLAPPSPADAGLLLTLALACTLLPFALSLVALREVSAFSVALAVNMEPVYAIFLAIVLLGEQRELGGEFYAGVAIILSTVFLHPVITRRR